jgi:hypothetical protein
MKMRFKCSNTHITCIVIILIILLLSPMFFFKKQSPYMLMEGMKNNNKKEGLTSKSTSNTPSASTSSASTLSTLTTPSTSTSTPSTSTSTSSTSTSTPSTTEGFANIEGSNNPSIFSMLFFKDTKFKPQCCPSSYSNSMGCACISNSQYKYLIERGGNNVPFSEY